MCMYRLEELLRLVVDSSREYLKLSIRNKFSTCEGGWLRLTFPGPALRGSDALGATSDATI